MINRRQFLKTTGLLGLSTMLPLSFWKGQARAALPDSIQYVAPATIPQIISIFLYGGPSELAGNLTNMADINANSQNPYPGSLDPANADNDITPNQFWGNAGGSIMEELLTNGQMSLYRTINRIKDDSKAHGRSVSQNLVGNLDLFNAGIATTLAAILAEFIAGRFNSENVNADLPIDPDTSTQIQYPDSNFGRLLRAAVSLAVSNPDTVFLSLGSGGLGGWDDHSGALDDYPGRMQGLMQALQVATRHMTLTNATNIVINVFGDFGRNVNLNGSMGWDHGNNQNFYTLAGSGLPGRALGKLVGKTQRIGTPFQNRQFTSPAAGSYQCEPFAIASSIFKYFGVQNPEVLTGESAIDESAGVPNEIVQL